MLCRLIRPFRELQQVEVHLHRIDATEPLSLLGAGEHTTVVGAHQLDIGALGVHADVETVGDLPRIGVDVHRHLPEASETFQRPCSWQARERVGDIE